MFKRLDTHNFVPRYRLTDPKRFCDAIPCRGSVCGGQASLAETGVRDGPFGPPPIPLSPIPPTPYPTAAPSGVASCVVTSARDQRD